MQPRHVLLALTIALVWGLNFVTIKLGLRNISPLALGVARFALTAFPLVFFVPRPKASIWLVAIYSLFTFALQFGFLFSGMQAGMSAGLSSLVLQLQVFFTIGLAVPILGQRPTLWQAAGALIAFGGIVVVAANAGGDVTLKGLVLLVIAAAAWGAGNIASRVISDRNPTENMMSLVVWGNMLAVPPLLILALIVEPEALASSFQHLDLISIASIAYIVYISTLFGFVAWNWLLGHYPVATVAPFTLLVPIFGFLSSAVLLGEPIEAWKLHAGGLVILGLMVNLFGGRLAKAASTPQK